MKSQPEPKCHCGLPLELTDEDMCVLSPVGGIMCDIYACPANHVWLAARTFEEAMHG